MTLIKERLRSYDLIIRVGGDEFVCALPDITVEEARERFAALREALTGGPTNGSVSVGFAQLEADDSPDDLVARADADLSKSRGRQ